MSLLNFFSTFFPAVSIAFQVASSGNESGKWNSSVSHSLVLLVDLISHLPQMSKLSD